MRSAVKNGGGLLPILGPSARPDVLSTLLGGTVQVSEASNTVGLAAVGGADPLMEKNVIWNSAPQIRERSLLTMSGSTTLVKAYETGEPVLLETHNGGGPTYILTPWLTALCPPHPPNLGGQGGSAPNQQLTEWPYFAYLVYHLAARAGGASPSTFADYPLSPVPHAGDRAAIVLIVVLMMATTTALFLTVRRYSRRHPDLLDHLVGHPDAYRRNAKAGSTDWERVGFHRPLAGFLVFFSVALIMFIPLMIYQVIIVPRLLVPSVQTYGTWNWVVNWFQVFWQLFDMGTSIALVKYLSELRVDQPREGMKYMQIFV